MFCTDCGKEINLEDKFCSNCGHQNKLQKSEDISFVLETSKIEDKSYSNETTSNDTTNTKSTSSNYFVKHWRGELPLGISYWVNNVLFNLILYFLATIIDNNLDFTEDNFQHFIPLILWGIIIIYTPWVLVGLWRSASNHIKKYDKHFWANIVKFLVVIGAIQFITIMINNGIPQIKEFIKIATKTDSIPNYEINILNNGKELEIKGGIKFGLTEDVQEYFIKYPNIQVLHINSIGGRIQEANKLHDFIKSKDIITYTSIGCYSACTNVFLAGKSRFINKLADLGFHRPSFPGIDNIDIKELIETEKKFYLSLNIPKDFIDKILSTPNNDMWKPSHYELLQSNIIDKVVDGDEFSPSDLYTWKDLKKLESDLLNIKIYQVIKTYEPNEFNKILNVFNKSVKLGIPIQDAYQETRSISAVIYYKYVSLASKEALNNFLDLIIRQFEILNDKDPILCYNYAMGLDKKIDPNKYFPKSLINFELDTMAKIIESGALQQNRIPTIEEVSKTNDNVYLASLLKSNEKLDLFNKKNPTNEEKVRMSKFFIIFYKELKKLPEEERIKYMRFLFKE